MNFNVFILFIALVSCDPSASDHWFNECFPIWCSSLCVGSRTHCAEVLLIYISLRLKYQNFSSITNTIHQMWLSKSTIITTKWTSNEKITQIKGVHKWNCLASDQFVQFSYFCSDPLRMSSSEVSGLQENGQVLLNVEKNKQVTETFQYRLQVRLLNFLNCVNKAIDHVIVTMDFRTFDQLDSCCQ